MPKATEKVLTRFQSDLGTVRDNHFTDCLVELLCLTIRVVVTKGSPDIRHLPGMS